MRVTRIDSEANAKVKRWKKLATESKAVKKEGLTLLEGIHVLEAAKNAKRKITAFIVREKASNEALQFLEKNSDIAPSFVLSNSIFDSICPVEHGVGLMCEMALNPEEVKGWETSDVLFLDGVQDAGNVGALIRAAVASGFKTIALTKDCANVWSAKVLRAAMGAHFGAKFIENAEIEEFRRKYKGVIWAADARGGQDLFETELDVAKPICWVMGSEGQGVSEKALNAADARLYIPIESDCESLNVATAAAVCLFDTRRRRKL